MTDAAFVGALEDVLRDTLGDVSVDEVRRMSSGASRETWAFDARAVDATHHLILQRRRHASTPGLDAMTEAHLLAAARSAGIAAPEVLAFGGQHPELGVGFVVTRRVAGESIPRRLLRDPEFDGARSRFVSDAAAQLAAIHRMDPGPHAGSLPRVDDELDVQRSLHEFLDDTHPVFDLVLRWLDHHRPPPRPPTVVHGDFRLGNLLIDDSGITAVLDWELATIGDPGLDLGWLAARSWRFGGPGDVAGIGSTDELIAAYAAEGGEPIDDRELRWWRALATLRWGNICRVMVGDHLQGRTRSVELATIGRRVAEVEYDLFMTLPELRS
jgi:aminoglycoside phosphotransferase (APT) family kinase protein